MRGPIQQERAVLLLLTLLFAAVCAAVNPIVIKGRHFKDSVTDETFYIRGVDYQPGGSAAVSKAKDPLSDVNTCARDIFLFQELGINTIRVYSVNPELNHDKCMTMLAAAGIYLVLDVNSPLENSHLNRYEPWESYHEGYLNHVFKVVEQFSGYNNTLAFFAGNEVINDEKSAEASPRYVKAVVRDLKSYMEYNSLRKIPVGYSAADDLKYRVSLAKYLECSDGSPLESIDFYGVNSYQWCGKQTFHTSGYNVLVDHYRDYTKPIFFSEFGCNEVSPRLFEEIQSIFSEKMSHVFCGGLVYEFSQEPNNYGLVDINDDGSVQLKEDFKTLQFQLAATADPPDSASKMSRIGSFRQKTLSPSSPRCEESYSNILIGAGLPASPADNLIRQRTRGGGGKFVPLSESELVSTFAVYDKDGKDIGKQVRVNLTTRPNKVAFRSVSSKSMTPDWVYVFLIIAPAALYFIIK